MSSGQPECFQLADSWSNVTKSRPSPLTLPRQRAQAPARTTRRNSQLFILSRASIVLPYDFTQPQDRHPSPEIGKCLLFAAWAEFRSLPRASKPLQHQGRCLKAQFLNRSCASPCEAPLL